MKNRLAQVVTRPGVEAFRAPPEPPDDGSADAWYVDHVSVGGLTQARPLMNGRGAHTESPAGAPPMGASLQLFANAPDLALLVERPRALFESRLAAPLRAVREEFLGSDAVYAELCRLRTAQEQAREAAARSRELAARAREDITAALRAGDDPTAAEKRAEKHTAEGEAAGKRLAALEPLEQAACHESKRSLAVVLNAKAAELATELAIEARAADRALAEAAAGPIASAWLAGQLALAARRPQDLLRECGRID
jgi:hypothetical protein